VYFEKTPILKIFAKIVRFMRILQSVDSKNRNQVQFITDKNKEIEKMLIGKIVGVKK
jgi:hypothetical protein